MTIEQFVKRLGKVGIDITLLSNYPWLYMEKVNNKQVREISNSKHHFTVAIQPIKIGDEIVWEDFSLIFKTVRKYL